MVTAAEPAAWITKRQAAAYASVSVRTIETWITEGRLRVARPSKRTIRTKHAWVDNALEAPYEDDE